MGSPSGAAVLGKNGRGSKVESIPVSTGPKIEILPGVKSGQLPKVEKQASKFASWQTVSTAAKWLGFIATGWVVARTIYLLANGAGLKSAFLRAIGLGGVADASFD